MRSRFTSLLFVIIFIFTVTTVWADSQARIVRLSYLEGDVQLDRGDGSGYIRAFLNMPLLEGAAVSTTSSGRAEVEFEDGSTIRLIPNTTVFFHQLRLRSEGSKITIVDLREGTAYFDVRRYDDDDFRVLGGGRELSLDKTSEFRVTHSAMLDPVGLRVAVLKGELRFTDPDGQRASIRKNETLSLDFADAGRYFLARGIADAAHDYWNRDRDRDREAANVRYQRASVGSLVYVSDLHHHGTYFDVVGYGRVWRPFAFGISWDPFSRGSWVYYPGHGYIFVSDYSWGWTPYRYGSWIHIANRGWCWRPGRGYNHWARGPVIANAPRGYVQPVVPVAPVTPVGRRGFIRVDGRPIDPADREDVIARYGLRDGVRNDVRRDPTGNSTIDGSTGGNAPILVQDRVRGVREVVRLTPADAGVSTSGGASVRSEGERSVGRTQLEGTSGTGGTVTPTSDPTVKTGDRRSRSEGYIGTQRTTDSPVVTPVTPATSTPVVIDRRIEDRPVRTPRAEVPSSPPPAPVMTDRPVRTPRSEPAPMPQPAPMQPPPQRMSPPPAQPSTPPPARVAPAAPAQERAPRGERVVPQESPK